MENNTLAADFGTLDGHPGFFKKSGPVGVLATEQGFSRSDVAVILDVLLNEIPTDAHGYDAAKALKVAIAKAF